MSSNPEPLASLSQICPHYSLTLPPSSETMTLDCGSLAPCTGSQLSSSSPPPQSEAILPLMESFFVLPLRYQCLAIESKPFGRGRSIRSSTSRFPCLPNISPLFFPFLFFSLSFSKSTLSAGGHVGLRAPPHLIFLQVSYLSFPGTAFLGGGEPQRMLPDRFLFSMIFGLRQREIKVFIRFPFTTLS